MIHDATNKEVHPDLTCSECVVLIRDELSERGFLVVAAAAAADCSSAVRSSFADSSDGLKSSVTSRSRM